MLSRRYRGDAYFSKKAHTISQNFHDDKLLFSLSKLLVNQ